jgi:hypothetical protein
VSSQWILVLLSVDSLTDSLAGFAGFSRWIRSLDTLAALAGFAPYSRWIRSLLTQDSLATHAGPAR